MLKIERLSEDKARQIGPHLWFNPGSLRCLDCGIRRHYLVYSTARPSTDAQTEAWLHRGKPCAPRPAH
jgi:hypothetical protein